MAGRQVQMYNLRDDHLSLVSLRNRSLLSRVVEFRMAVGGLAASRKKSIMDVQSASASDDSNLLSMEAAIYLLLKSEGGISALPAIEVLLSRT